MNLYKIQFQQYASFCPKSLLLTMSLLCRWPRWQNPGSERLLAGWLQSHPVLQSQFSASGPPGVALCWGLTEHDRAGQERQNGIWSCRAFNNKTLRWKSVTKHLIISGRCLGLHCNTIWILFFLYNWFALAQYYVCACFWMLSYSFKWPGYHVCNGHCESKTICIATVWIIEPALWSHYKTDLGICFAEAWLKNFFIQVYNLFVFLFILFVSTSTILVAAMVLWSFYF